MIDKSLFFADAQAVTADAASDNSHLSSSARKIGVGTPLYFHAALLVAMTDAASNSTCTVTLQADDDVGFGGLITICTLPVFAALSPAGTVRCEPVGMGFAGKLRLRAFFTMANGDLTTGTFSVWLSSVQKSWSAKPQAISIG